MTTGNTQDIVYDFRQICKFSPIPSGLPILYVCVCVCLSLYVCYNRSHKSYLRENRKSKKLRL